MKSLGRKKKTKRQKNQTTLLLHTAHFGKMYTSFLSLIVFIVAFATTSIQLAQGCRCFPSTIESSYHRDIYKHFVLAFVVRQTTRPSNFNTYELRILANFKGCPRTGTVIVRTPLSSAQCGVQFRLRNFYVLPLRDEEMPTVTSCDVRPRLHRPSYSITLILLCPLFLTRFHMFYDSLFRS